jgi:Ca2+-transporting ATPase
MNIDWHLLPLNEVSEKLDTSHQVLMKIRLINGNPILVKNKIKYKKKNTVLLMILHQLSNFMILILIFCGIVSRFLGGITDTVIILIIVIVNAVIGFVQEYRAEKRWKHLKM